MKDPAEEAAPLLAALAAVGRPASALELIAELDRRTPHRLSGKELVLMVIAAKDAGLVEERITQPAQLQLTARGRRVADEKGTTE